jgi:hypothetical protein
MADAGSKVLSFVRDGAPIHPSLDDLPPEVLPYLEAALAGLKSRTEDVPSQGVRLFLGEGELLFSDWTAGDLRGCLEDSRPAAEAWREVVRTLAFLLKVREDLSSYRSRTTGGDDPGPAFVPMLERDLDLFADTFTRIEESIDAAVLRGELVGARNLSRFRDLLLPYRLQSRLALDEVRRESEEYHRKQQASEATPRAGVKAPLAKGKRKPARPTAADSAAAATQKAPDPRGQLINAPFRTSLEPVRAPYRFPIYLVLLVALALSRWAMGIHHRAIANPEPSFSGPEVTRFLPHESTFAAGGVLYATVGSDWDELERKSRIDRFARLCKSAEKRGFAGVVLLDPAGDFVARWSRGSIPMVWNR